MQAVTFADLRSFAIEIDDLSRRRLHAIGQLVRLNAGRQIGLTRMIGQVPAIEPVDQVDRLALRAVADSGGRHEVEQGDAPLRNSVP